MSAGLIVVTRVDTGVSQAAEGHGLPERIVKAGRGCHGTAQDGDPLMQVAPPVEISRHRPGELPGVAVRACFGGKGDGGEQDLVLGLEPGQGLPVIGGLLGGRYRGLAVRGRVARATAGAAGAAAAVCR